MQETGSSKQSIGMIDHQESLDYFDAMEVIYYDDMLQENSDESSSSSSSSLATIISSIAIEDNDDVEDDEFHDATTEEQAKLLLRSKRKKLRKMAHEQRKRLEAKLHMRRKKIKQIMSKPDVVMSIDKISFVCGVLIIIIIEGVLLLAPQRMDELYTTLLIPLMIARYIIYRSDLYVSMISSPVSYHIYFVLSMNAHLSDRETSITLCMTFATSRKY